MVVLADGNEDMTNLSIEKIDTSGPSFHFIELNIEFFLRCLLTSEAVIETTKTSVKTLAVTHESHGRAVVCRVLSYHLHEVRIEDMDCLNFLSGERIVLQEFQKEKY